MYFIAHCAESEAGAGELDLRARELLRIIGEEDAHGAVLSVGHAR